MTDAIPKHRLAAAGRALRFHILAEMNRAFARSGLTYVELASRLDCPPYLVRRTLKGQRRLTLRIIGEMFYAIDGSCLDIEFIAKPREDQP